MVNGRIDKYQFEEGYCQAEKSSSDKNKDIFTFYYYDQDHLGNIRQVREANGSKGYVIQTMNYYPFGAEFRDGSANTSVQKQKYNGKEFDNMHGLNSYDYGARQYNPVTARWDRIDPLAEKYYIVSPYNYCMNNPVKYIDPDGRDGKVTGTGTKDDPYVITAEYYYKNGDFTDEQIKTINSGLNAYNNQGTIKMKTEEGTSYIKYNLSLKGADDPETARLKNTMFKNTNGDHRYYGNVIRKKPHNGDEYGSADNISIHFNMPNIDAAVKDGAQMSRILKGVTIHEVAHNLGLDHSDQTSEMNIIQRTDHIQQIGPSYTIWSYPSISSNGMKLIFKRRDLPYNQVGRIWTEKKG